METFFAIKYGKGLIKNIFLAWYGHFSAFCDLHLPTSHLKQTFEEVWEKEQQYLCECGSHRFRKWTDATHWVMKNWRYCKGQFMPRSVKWGKSFVIGKDAKMIPAIKSQKYKAVCVNDCDPTLDFEKCQAELIEAFESILPEKCSFEKQVT